MKKVVQLIAGNLRPEVEQGWRRWCERVIVHDDMSALRRADTTVPLVGALNIANKAFRRWMKLGYPFVCLNRPYIGGWNVREHNLRVSVNAYACTRAAPVPHGRWDKWNVERHPWKVREVRNVLIAPPNKNTFFCLGVDSLEWAHEQAQWFRKRGATVRYRMKSQKGTKRLLRYQTLWQDLDWADLVVSYSSAITVEAFWYGKKVITPGVCPTWMCGTQNYDSWQDPREPDQRDAWHEHLAWTQFSEEEWSSGDAQEMVMLYQGDLLDHPPTDNPYTKIKSLKT